MKVPFARSFGWAFSPILLAGALFAAGFAAPKPVSAAEPATATAPVQPPPAASDAATRAQDEEREESDVYRKASPVEAISRKLGLGDEAGPRLFEAINFLIIVFAIVVPLVRILPKVLRKRSETLNHDIMTAREATADANARLSVVEAKLAGLDAEIQRFRTQIEQESLEDEKRIKASIEEESARIVAAAEQEIAQAAAQARRGLRTFAADLAIEHAEKQLVLTPEVDRAVIDEFIAGVAKGGSK